MLAREKRVLPCLVAGILSRINAGFNLICYYRSLMFSLFHVLGQDGLRSSFGNVVPP